MPIWSRITGAIAGIGVGGAAAAAMEPILEVPRQKAWQGEPNRVLDMDAVARLVAQGLLDIEAAVDEVERQGFNGNRLRAAVQLALAGPPVAETLELWRRGKIDRAQAEHALDKAQIEAQYHEGILELFNERLDPAQVALGIVRSLISSHGLLVGEHETSGGVVPSTPLSDLDPLAEARASGIDEERLRVLVGEIGLPMSLQQAASAFFRGIIEHPDFYLAVAQGDTRPAWADAILEQARAILSANQYAELELRGFLDREQRLAKTDQYGMSHADSDLLYDLLGRSIPVHQITTGRARGGVYDGPTEEIPRDYLASLERGNLRREYFNLAYANRYSLPSAFVIRALLTGGAITKARGQELFEQIGWPPDLAATVADFYGQATTTKPDPHVAKAQTQLWTATHRSYLTGELADTDATTALEAAGVPAGSVPAILTLWAQEHDLARKLLTAAQIKRAYQKAAKNEATGAPWTRDEAIAALQERGYPPLQANDYLNIK